MAALAAAVISALGSAESSDSANSDQLISQAGKNGMKNAQGGNGGFTPVAASFAPGVSGSGAGSMPVRNNMTGQTSSPSFGAIATPNSNSGQPQPADTLDIPDADTGVAGDASAQSTGAQMGASAAPNYGNLGNTRPDPSAPAGTQAANAANNASNASTASTISQLGGLGVSLGQMLQGGPAPQGSFPAPGGSGGGYQPTALQALQAAARRRQMGLI